MKDIQDRLAYADQALRDPKRKLSPIGIRALRLYDEACFRLLDLEEGEIYEDGEQGLDATKHEWKSKIRTYDQDMQYTACLVMTRSEDAQELQEQLLKTEAEAKKVDGWQMFQKHYWTEIDANLKYEADAYNRVLAGELVHDKCPTYLAVSHACNHIGFNMSDMIQAIRLYSERNGVVRTNIIQLIKSGRFFDLAKHLYDDFCDISLLISDYEDLTDLLKHLVESIIDLWFDRDDMDRDNYQMWIPTQKLRDHHRQLYGNPSTKSTVQKTMHAEIVKSLKKRLRVAEENDMVRKLSRNFESLSGEKNRKRVASSQLEGERERAKRMKVEWSKIVNPAQGVRKMSDTYFQNYGELAPPPEIIHDPSLDE